MSDGDRWTIGRLLQWTTDYLKKSGSASARLDAEILLAESRGCQRIQLYTAFDEDPGEAVRTKFRDLVKRRAAGEPVAYLVGRREFYSLMFQTTPAVLIPRPETEFVVIGVLDAVKHLNIADRPVEIADVGTGSGAIAVSVAKHMPTARVTAIDISPEAIVVAKSNAERHEVADRIEFHVSDLFAAIHLEKPAKQFDIVASNPPYIATSEMDSLARDVRDYEPQAALLGGHSGMDVIDRLVAQCTEKIVPGGWLVMEIGPALESTIRERFENDSRWSDLTITKDLAGLARVVKIRRAVH
jgi:release factor glutamine methyltransferase